MTNSHSPSSAESAVQAILEGWFGEAIEHMDDGKRVRKFLLEPLVKAATSSDGGVENQRHAARGLRTPKTAQDGQEGGPLGSAPDKGHPEKHIAGVVSGPSEALLPCPFCGSAQTPKSAELAKLRYDNKELREAVDRLSIPALAQGASLRQALIEVTKCETALRMGGPAPEDLEGLSIALEKAVEIAANALDAAQPQVAPVETKSASEMIAACYEGLCPDGSSALDFEWARQRGYILPNNGSGKLSPAQCSAGTGYDEPQGYAASLRQMAKWVREAVDPRTADSQRITLDDIDAEELDAAAAFIDRLRDVPQTASLPVEALRAAVTLVARKITKLSWSRDECRCKGQDIYVANLTAQIDQLDGYHRDLSALVLTRPHHSSEEN